jgi:tetratricopeptide (TPR) repeat protein
MDEARRALGELDSGPTTELRRAAIEVYEADYASAKTRLTKLLASAPFDPSTKAGRSALGRAERLLALTTGATTALGGAPAIRSPDGRFEVAFASSRDELLAPYLFEALDVAFQRVGDAIGDRPTAPVRFEFVDDSAKLALITPLDVDAIYTTGTIGVTKYNRVMMVTPRVMLQGYAWLDAATHEYVHYVVTRRTKDNAPVWLQEGLAKLYETRWRRDSPAPLRPEIAAILRRAVENDDLVSFEEMSPSVALLPTRERAALAYAQVETMLGLLLERRGSEGMQTLLDRVASGTEAEQAFADAWGDEFSAFEDEWKRHVRAITRHGRSGSLGGPRFKDPGAEEDGPDPSLFGDVFSHLGGGRARQHARLGVLLTLRDHPEAAILEYEKARKADPRVAKDPALARRLGELYLDAGRAEEAAPLLQIAGAADPENPNVAAAEGRALLRTGRREEARPVLDRALSINPFIPTLHCDLAELAAGEDPQMESRERALCSE